MGSWALQEVGQQLKEWREKGGSPLHISVNVSALQLKHANFLKEIDDMLDINALDPSFIEIEITESGLMNHTDGCLQYSQQRSFSSH